ncbi:response regulator transcription factor [soil metagenome]
MTIKVLLADDQSLLRAGFKVLINSAPDLTVVGEASNGEEAVQMARTTGADVVLMDIRMPVLDGIAATKRIKSDPALVNTKVLVLTTFETDEHVVDAIRAGASGFLLKDAEFEELLDAIRVVARGEALLAPSVTRRLIAAFVAAPEPRAPSAPAAQLEQLTERELEVLTLVASGLNNFEIADRLFMSAATSKTHVSRIMAKLDARDRAQLVVIAYETGLVTPGG